MSSPPQVNNDDDNEDDYNNPHTPNNHCGSYQKRNTIFIIIMSKQNIYVIHATLFLVFEVIWLEKIYFILLKHTGSFH